LWKAGKAISSRRAIRHAGLSWDSDESEAPCASSTSPNARSRSRAMPIPRFRPAGEANLRALFASLTAG
jgi:hypothetical protein